MAGITGFHLEGFSPAQATAGTVQAIVLGRAPKAGTLTGVRLIPVGAVATDAADGRIWTVQNRGSAGTGTTAMASWSTLTAAQGALVAYDEAAMVLNATAANLVVAAGDIIAVLETVAASGKAHTGVKFDATFDQIYATT